MRENIGKDRIWNKDIRLKIGMVFIDEKTRENCLR